MPGTRHYEAILISGKSNHGSDIFNQLAPPNLNPLALGTAYIPTDPSVYYSVYRLSINFIPFILTYTLSLHQGIARIFVEVSIGKVKWV